MRVTQRQSRNYWRARVVVLPPQVRLHDLVLGPEGGWRWEGEEAPDLTIAISRPPATHVEPVGLAMLSAWADFQRSVGREPRLDPSVKCPLTWQIGLLSRLAGRDAPRQRKHTLGPWVIRSEPAFVQNAWFDDIDRLGIPDEGTRDVVAHCLEDLCRNVFQHAQTRGGGAHVAASYDPSSRLVRLGVADCGQGIARDIREHHGEDLSEIGAVRLALEPQVSGSREPDLNQGVGLYVVRRLALAAEGALWVRTGRVVATASGRDPSSIEPDVREEGACWKGTAVASTFKAGLIDQCHQAIWQIRREIEPEGNGDVQIFKTASDEPGWVRVGVTPDVRSVALDRHRALQLAREPIAQALNDDLNVTLDFSSTRTTTQAFCYALLSGAARAVGRSLLRRIRFVAVSRQVRPLILMALHAGFSEGEGD